MATTAALGMNGLVLAIGLLFGKGLIRMERNTQTKANVRGMCWTCRSLEHCRPEDFFVRITCGEKRLSRNSLPWFRCLAFNHLKTLPFCGLRESHLPAAFGKVRMQHLPARGIKWTQLSSIAGEIGFQLRSELKRPQNCQRLETKGNCYSHSELHDYTD